MFDSRSRRCRFKPHQRHCIVSLSLFLFILCLVLVQSKEDDKYQESIQSSTIWDSDKTQQGNNTQKPIDQPFQSRWPQGCKEQT